MFKLIFFFVGLSLSNIFGASGERDVDHSSSFFSCMGSDSAPCLVVPSNDSFQIVGEDILLEAVIDKFHDKNRMRSSIAFTYSWDGYSQMKHHFAGDLYYAFHTMRSTRPAKYKSTLAGIMCVFDEIKLPGVPKAQNYTEYMKLDIIQMELDVARGVEKLFQLESQGKLAYDTFDKLRAATAFVYLCRNKDKVKLQEVALDKLRELRTLVEEAVGVVEPVITTTLAVFSILQKIHEISTWQHEKKE